jgi:hypothetical protein
MGERIGFLEQEVMEHGNRPDQDEHCSSLTYLSASPTMASPPNLYHNIQSLLGHTFPIGVQECSTTELIKSLLPNTNQFLRWPHNNSLRDINVSQNTRLPRESRVASTSHHTFSNSQSTLRCLFTRAPRFLQIDPRPNKITLKFTFTYP